MKKFFTLFAGIALAGSLAAMADTVTLYPCTYNGDSMGDSQLCEISKNEAGDIVISDFLYSETPLSFKFEIPDPGKNSNITFTGNLDREYNYPYFMDAEGNYPTMWLQNYSAEEEWTPIYWPYLAEEGYSYVYRYDLSDPENAGYKEYYGCICLSGTAADDSYFPWTYVNFYFDIPAESAVDAVEAASDAPEVFFNLAGQRVENPSDGVFIRLQGGKATKVVK